MAQVVYRVSVPIDGKRVTRRFRTRAEVDAFTAGFDSRDVRVMYDARVHVGPKEIAKSFKRRKDADAWAATTEVETSCRERLSRRHMGASRSVRWPSVGLHPIPVSDPRRWRRMAMLYGSTSSRC